MRLLLFLLATAIVYGSVYPFDFRLAAIDRAEIDALLGNWLDPTEKADLVSNLGMFVPYGCLAALIALKRRRVALALVLHLIIAAMFAIGLQVLQLWIPTRFASMNDVVWNMLGFLAGAVIALVPWLRIDPVNRYTVKIDAIPSILIGAWLAYRLFPYVPSLDFQNLKDNLEPLFLDPQFVPTKILRDAVAWMIVGLAARHAFPTRRPDLFLPALILADFGGEILILNNGVTASDAIGASVALALWGAWLARARKPEIPLAAALAATIFILGIAPFELRQTPAPFDWLPFHAYLDGSVRRGFLVLLEKSFLYGSLIWLIRAAGTRWRFAAAVTIALAGGVEFAQIYFDYHSPELSDPLHAALLAITLATIALRQRPTPAGTNPAFIPAPTALAAPATKSDVPG